jgi:uncharacterized protein (DUF433 family)
LRFLLDRRGANRLQASRLWYTRRKNQEGSAVDQSDSVITEPKEANALPVISEHIVSTPDTCGGAPRIAGSRIRVNDIVIWHFHQGMSPEQIISTWPQLTLAGIHSALAYYHDRKD